MACSTGLACGLTLTRSGASRWANHSAVISDTIEALEAWWPPTFTPLRFSRTRLAWWTMLVASHSTRRWTRSSVCRSTSVRTASAMGSSLFAEAVVHALEAGPQLARLLEHALAGERAGDQVGDPLHLRHPHPQPRDLGRADAQAARAVPVLRGVAGHE